MDQDATWYGGRPWPWPHCVRWGPSSSPKGAHPQFSAHVCYGQTDGWIKKLPLDRELGLGPGHTIRWGPSSQLTPPPKTSGALADPTFRPMYCGQTAGWIKMLLGMEVGFGPGHIVLDGDLAAPPKGHTPNFRSMSVVAKRLDGSRYHLTWR